METTDTPKILIIGESCLDIFTYCTCTRFCPDVPVPVLKAHHHTANEGMALNVYRNIVSLLRETNAPSPLVWTNDDYQQMTKNRFVHMETNHMFCRVDGKDTCHRIEFNDELVNAIEMVDIVVISDYNKGFLTCQDIERITEHHGNVFIDTKKPLGLWARRAKFIKINAHEYAQSLPWLTQPHHTAFERESVDNIKDNIIHTTGSEGCVYQGKTYPVDVPVEVKDSSGAGDTFMAGLVVKYAQTGDIEQSIKFANKVASEAVKHRGVTIAK